MIYIIITVILFGHHRKCSTANIIPYILTLTPTKIFLYLGNKMLQVILKINNPVLSEKDDAIQLKGRNKSILDEIQLVRNQSLKAIKGVHQTIFKKFMIVQKRIWKCY